MRLNVLSSKEQGIGCIFFSKIIRIGLTEVILEQRPKENLKMKSSAYIGQSQGDTNKEPFRQVKPLFLVV